MLRTNVIPLVLAGLLIVGCAKVDRIVYPEPQIQQKAKYHIQPQGEGKYQSILRARVENAIHTRFYYTCITRHAEKRYGRVGIDNNPTPTAVDTVMLDCSTKLIIRVVAVNKSIMGENKETEMYWHVPVQDLIRRLQNR